MRRNEFKVEVCVNSLPGVLAAKDAKADSVNLCSGMIEGGTTPSFSFIRHACAIEGITVNVMIRPRSGDFLYDDLERDVILQDIAAAKFLGADGIIGGVLNADGSIDADFTKKCVDAAYPLPFSFHRAFDMCRDPFEALEVLEYCGCVRVLTSGMKNSALEGSGLVRQLVEKSRHVEIMAGSGITPENIGELAKKSNAKAFYLSARVPKESGMMFRNTGIAIGKLLGSRRNPATNEYITETTSAEKIREVIGTLEKI